MSKFFKFIFKPPDSLDPAKHKPLEALITGCIIAVITTAILSFVFWKIDSAMMYVSAASSIISLVFIYLLRNQGKINLVLFLVAVMIIIHQAMAIWFFGWDWGFQYYFFIIMCYVFLQEYDQLKFPIILCIASVTSFFLSFYIIQHINAPHIFKALFIVDIVHALNALVTCIAIGIMSYIFGRSAYQAEQRLLETERSKHRIEIANARLSTLSRISSEVAHEVQNPLQFVNNFSQLNQELVDELKEQINTTDKDSIEETLNDISELSAKIHEHGIRASGIVDSLQAETRKARLGELVLDDQNPHDFSKQELK